MPFWKRYDDKSCILLVFYQRAVEDVFKEYGNLNMCR